MNLKRGQKLHGLTKGSQTWEDGTLVTVTRTRGHHLHVTLRLETGLKTYCIDNGDSIMRYAG